MNSKQTIIIYKVEFLNVIAIVSPLLSLHYRVVFIKVSITLVM
jgi:hypothetical protein